ncbi:MAG: hypothetical protein ACK4MV_00835 [Beijerinckiaceae bacterium]
MISVLTPLALAFSFAGVCALAYLKLAKGRRNVRRESLLIFAVLLVFTLARLLTFNF